MYAGGPVDPVRELLAEDVVWHVPGASPIYRFELGRVAEAWLVPLDSAKFERIWNAGRIRRR
ncbi:MAG TPA: hypothetical protein VF085_01225 [Solirubrobacterales bacterium]